MQGGQNMTLFKGCCVFYGLDGMVDGIISNNFFSSCETVSLFAIGQIKMR